MKNRLLWRVLVSYLAVAGLCAAGGVALAWWAGDAAARWAAGGAALAVAAASLSWLAAAGFARPVEEIRRGADRLGRGDLKVKITPAGSPELLDLAESMNRMARQLDARIAEITRERNEREAILESMQEGVLAIDREERVLTVNRQAEQLLGVSLLRSRGRLVQEAIRNADLQRYLASIQRAGHTEPEEGAPIRGHGGMVLAAKSAPLRDAEGRSVGMVVVLANVTRLRELENLRREFVANVSHELRTPITSLKGYAETLLDGALEDGDQARRFVEVIARQADRLGEIIEDLLALSRLERSDSLEVEEVRLEEMLRDAMELCADRAGARRGDLRLHCEEGIRARVSPRLLEQAVTNLVDNALKYSPAGSPVEVSAARAGAGLVIAVEDRGGGIAAEHLPRLFERFYRVDKARSRDVGGTGLGLSIVKNVAVAHGGDVGVESTVGRGSRFTIKLPAGVLVDS